MLTGVELMQSIEQFGRRNVQEFVAKSETPRPEGRGRSTQLTALSLSNGLPGDEISFYIAPLYPAYKAGACGGRSVHDMRDVLTYLKAGRSFGLAKVMPFATTDSIILENNKFLTYR